MSKILYVIYRDKKVPHEAHSKLKKICSDINPDNIDANPTYSYQDGQVICGLSNPLTVIKKIKTNVLLGQILTDGDEWTKPLIQYPDGNFAIFRSNSKNVEILTDALGTRSVWYFKNDQIFICATSQRAIIKYLGDFEFDDRVIPWIISTGSLGPLFSWDRRVKRIKPATSLILERNNWRLTFKSLNYYQNKNKKEKNLNNRIYDSLNTQYVNLKKWALTLSGGYDSRLILLYLNKYKNVNERIRTITWGLKDSKSIEDSDASIAEKLAREYNTDHSFFSTKISKEPVKLLLDRFLKNGDGRIDHISSYMNGFDIWKYLFDNKYEGIIRGNQLLSSLKPVSEFDVRRFMGLALISDYDNLKNNNFLKSLEQFIPDEFSHRNDESLFQYRDRILADYRIPVIQAALSDLKFPYVEQFDPLLVNSIATHIRSFPSEIRDDKVLVKKILASLDNHIKFAKKDATKPKEELFKQERMKNEIISEINSKTALRIFPKNFLGDLNASLKETEKSDSKSILKKIKQSAVQFLPDRLKKYLVKSFQTPSLDTHTLGFRVMIIIKMYRILQTGGENIES